MRIKNTTEVELSMQTISIRYFSVSLGLCNEAPPEFHNCCFYSGEGLRNNAHGGKQLIGSHRIRVCVPASDTPRELASFGPSQDPDMSKFQCCHGGRKSPRKITGCTSLPIFLSHLRLRVELWLA